MLRKPPDILITTPESLFLLLTSRGARDARGVETLILDEVHAVAGTKRGAHLALSLERLDAAASATPVAARSGSRRRSARSRRSAASSPAAGRSELVDAGTRKELDLEVVVPRRGHARARRAGRTTTRRLPTAAARRRAPRAASARSGRRSTPSCSSWSSAPLDDRLRQQPPARRAARAAAERAGRGGDRARPPRLARARAARRDRGAAEGAARSRASSPPRRSSSASTWAPSTSSIQVESPKSVARGLQRIGRAGHELGAVSKGRDLPEVPRRPARVARSSRSAMRDGEIEETAIPRNPLDVLAQQIVAICGRGGDRGRRAARARPRRVPVRRPLARAARERARHARRAATRRTSSPSCGRGSSGTAPAASIRGREGARRLAVTNAGTIPDRGLFGVYLVDGGGRVGELDEEMVYEARAGPDVPARRLDVADRGDHARPRARLAGAGRARARCRSGRARASAGRTSSAQRSARASRELVALRRRRRRWRACATSTTLDERAARNLLVVPARAGRPRPAPCRPTARSWSSASATRSATGASASSRRSAARVHAPWAMALAARLRDVARPRGAVDLVGRRHRAPPPRRRRAAADRRPAARPGRDRGARRRGGRPDGALRRALPRERGARAADPAPPPGPAHAALAAAAEGAVAAAGRAQVRLVPDRARDLPRVPAGRLRPARAARLLHGAPHARARPRRGRDRRRASPFAASLLFDYVATYMYEDDTPPAERRAQALSLDRDLLRELLGQEELRDLLDPRRARGGRAAAARRRRATPTSCTTCCACAATCVAGEYDEGFAEPLLARAARDPRPRSRARSG